MTVKVFYVEEWTTQYKIWRVKADSEDEVRDIYWDEKKEGVELLLDDILDNTETNFYEEKDRKKMCIWEPHWEVSDG